MCVKFGLLLWEKNVHYECLTVGCLGKYLGLRDMKELDKLGIT